VDASDSPGFLGTGWGFPLRFDPRSKAVSLSAGEVDIAQSLFILMSTTPGERVMQPAYGCGLKGLVFETIDASRVTEIQDLISRAVLHFEPRIELLTVSVDGSDLLQGRLQLTLHYLVRSTNTRHNLVYPLYLDEASAAGFGA
jgi:uncharacterized protein